MNQEVNDMNFSSSNFLFLFLPVSVFLYYLVPKIQIKNIILVIVSLVFYGFGEPRGIVLLVVCTLVNYLLGYWVGNYGYGDRKNFLTAFAVIFNLCVLVYFKLFAALMGSQTAAIPIGVSFFTFQCIAYQVDIYRKKIDPQKNIISFSLFIMIFPKMISGPILRYDDMGKQINERQHSWELMAQGITRFTVGLGKKVILADLAAGLVSSNLGPSMASPIQAWFGLLMFAFQLYFDFSGYSDMAIGLGKIFGFHFPENFDYPYISTSISQFWRRWHITLGSFFKDYIYIPLGGNRHRYIFNLLVVWMVTALWHGVGSGFIMWGLYHFVLVLADKKVNLKVPVFLARIGTFLLVYFGWTFFYYGSLGEWLHFMQVAFNMNEAAILPQGNMALILNNIPLILLCFLAATPILPWLKKKIPEKVQQPLSMACTLCLLFISITFIYSQNYVPFLYSNF